MTQYTRTITRQVTNAWPAWRVAMTETDKVYTFGDAPSTMSSQLVVPGGTLPAGFEDTSLMVSYDGWNGAADAWDLGTFGSAISTYAGEGVWPNTLQRFDYATGEHSYDQQPHWNTTKDAATAANSDWFYDTALAASINASRPLAKLNSSWDRAFPALALTSGSPNGWIYWRKPITFSHGNNEAYQGRYNMPAWVPASMTGLGVGALFINQANWAGYPGVNGPQEVPSGIIPTTDFLGDTWTDGRRKFWVHYKNLHTGEWGRLADPVPETALSAVDVHWAYSAVDTVGKRLYYLNIPSGQDPDYYYWDLSSGIASATLFGPYTATTQFAFGWGVRDGTSAVLTDGHPTGRRLFYFLLGTRANSLMMVDFDNDETWRLDDIPGMNLTGWTLDKPCAFAYRASTNELIITMCLGADAGADNVQKVSIPIPSDPTDSANYSATTISLPFASGHSGTDTAARRMYGRAKWHPALQCITWRQRNGPYLAYVPS